MNKEAFLVDVLQRSLKPIGTSDRLAYEFYCRKGKETHKFTYWEDYRNDCWCITLPNGNTTDTSYFDDVFDIAFQWLKDNYD